MSLRLWLLIAGNRWLVKPAVSHAEEPEHLREMFERSARKVFRPPPLSAMTDTKLAHGLMALRIRNRPAARPQRPRKVILYFHGGAFVTGSPRTHAGLMARLSRMTRTEVIAPAYRLAPEHPFPAAPDDAWTAFQALIARGYRAQDIVLGGDSAGGNLALGLLARALEAGERPAGLFAFSPVTDLAFTGASLAANAAADPALPASETAKIQSFYLQGADPDDPRASPLHAHFESPPPVFLQVARNEILFDDSLRMARRLKRAGGKVTLDIWDNTPHVFVMFENLVPEARTALKRAGRFVNELFDGQSETRKS
jgi:acetyl esterase/lipase